MARLAYRAPARNSDQAWMAAREEILTSGKAVRLAALGLPLLDVIAAGCGRMSSGLRYSESVVGSRMRYVNHSERDRAPGTSYRWRSRTPALGWRPPSIYQVLVGGGVLRSTVRLVNAGASAVTVESVTSFLGGGLAGPGGDLDDVELLWAENDWAAEARWQRRPLRDALPDSTVARHGPVTGHGSLLTSRRELVVRLIPCRWGRVANRRRAIPGYGRSSTMAPWHWQLGEHIGGGLGLSYLALFGPTDVEHQWRLLSQPGGVLRNRPGGRGREPPRVSKERLAPDLLPEGDTAPPRDHHRLPVIFNDYMNTLMGDPTTDGWCRSSALPPAPAPSLLHRCGLVRRDRGSWWDTVGAWSPPLTGSLTESGGARPHPGRRHGPRAVARTRVVGARSPVAEQLPTRPSSARRPRVVEQGRYHLDFFPPRRPAHLDQVVDLLVGDWALAT